MPAEGRVVMRQGVIKLHNQQGGPVVVIQKHAEVNNRTGKILVRDMKTGRFAPKSETSQEGT